jgi:hypothetical protein
MAPSNRGTWIALAGVMVAAGLVNLPAMHGPLALDDYAQRAMIEGALTPHRGVFNLYDFVSDSNRAALLGRGAIPWWTDPRLSIRFLRPLSSALVWLDHRLFGHDPFFPHLLSLLLFLGAIVAAHGLYRTSLSLRPALIAVTIFAFSPSHTIPLVWLANRDILLSLAMGAAALSLYVEWRSHRRPGLGLASTAAFAFATLTGEYAVSLAGYVLALEIFRKGEPIRRRLIGLAPFALPLFGYGAVHFLLRYGAIASGFYRDPFAAPALFGQAFPRAFSVLLASSWLGLDEVAGAATPAGLTAFIALAILVLFAGFAWWARRVPSEWRAMAWLPIGSLFALCPLAATEPTRRILGIAALGVSSAVAVVVEMAWRTLEGKRWTPRAISALCCALILGYVHLARAPMEAHRLARQAVEDERWYERRLAAAVKRSDRPASTIIVMRANYPSTVLWTPFMLGEAAPEHWWVLTQTFEESTAIRTGPNSLDLIQEEGPLFATGPADMFRIAPPTVGEVVELPGLRATVTRVDADGRPKSVHFEFDRNLDDPEIAWIVEARSGFRPVVPPPVGFGVRMAP